MGLSLRGQRVTGVSLRLRCVTELGGEAPELSFFFYAYGSFTFSIFFSGSNVVSDLLLRRCLLSKLSNLLA